MTPPEPSMPAPDSAARVRRMNLLARATRDELQHALAGLPDAGTAMPVRGPETGLIMLRGRIGGGGNAFNLGEATVTRATVRLSCGTIGHGQRLGTDRDATRLAAITDALAETGRHDEWIDDLLQGIATRIDAEALQQTEETAATRVDFFTLVRGEDQ